MPTPDFLKVSRRLYGIMKFHSGHLNHLVTTHLIPLYNAHYAFLGPS